MSKQILLSTELSRCRALLAGGSSLHEIETRLLRWNLISPQRGHSKPSPVSLKWYTILTRSIEDFKQSGASFLQVLSHVQPLIRMDEHFFRKRQTIQKQYALQGALGIVLPWAVAAFVENFKLNIFTCIALAMQALGLIGFFLIFSISFSEKKTEENWLLEFLHTLLPKVASQNSLLESIKLTLQNTKSSSFQKTWLDWLCYFESSSSQKEFIWPDSVQLSQDFADFLEHLIRTGSPAFGCILDYIEALSFERSSRFEDQIASLPSKVSLIFCLCFAPSVLFILLGSLWPMIQNL